jgi:hypothetical protein
MGSEKVFSVVGRMTSVHHALDGLWLLVAIVIVLWPYLVS